MVYSVSILVRTNIDCSLPFAMSFSPRSMLFVSAEKPARFARALASGADMVCIDLEDAVHPDNKQQARGDVVRFLSDRSPVPGVALGVRINPVETSEGLADIHALVSAPGRIDVIVLPKVTSPRDVTLCQSWFSGYCDGIVALLETPGAIETAVSIARGGVHSSSGPALLALMLGGADLASELGAAFAWDSLLPARGRLVNAAKAAGLQAWDVPHLALDEPDAVAAETRAVRAMGFDCKAAIHPAQLDAIHDAFAPSGEELAWARGVIEAGEANGHGASGDGRAGAFLHKGKMVDEPVLKHARRLVAQSAAAQQ